MAKIRLEACGDSGMASGPADYSIYTHKRCDAGYNHEYLLGCIVAWNSLLAGEERRIMSSKVYPVSVAQICMFCPDCGSVVLVDKMKDCPRCTNRFLEPIGGLASGYTRPVVTEMIMDRLPVKEI